MKNDYLDINNKIGILISNLGTPNSTSIKDLKKYINEFLMDKRVINLPRILWIPILKLIILNLRPRKSAKLYRVIWTNEGSPLLSFSKKIVEKLSTILDKRITLALGMRYGSPSISEAMNIFRQEKISKILVLPLYPQTGSPTTSSTFDAVANYLKDIPWMPELRFVSGYHDQDDYINALVKSINACFKNNGKPDKLIFSFHGMPYRYLEKGDPYYCFCQKTARLTSEKLNLNENSYDVAFQSRFGPDKWLEPYIDKLLIDEATSGTKYIQVISPGFAVDCLETLEEINIQYRKLFITNGGEKFEYIPCLNDGDNQIKLLYSIINNSIKGW
ncbi:MAG: ferrochelatase [Candidatus Marinimicrobia bacterium]|nr:ferrochelatase [Candidatus Neomarinimicrobiota bacterium]|tara:strand:+ start:98 stop:1090 length:993 start_codon:yes stop_codon:yes gene_type:complete